MHTKGPWEYMESAAFGVNGKKIGHCYTSIPSDRKLPPREEARANARIITAAPELLEACKYVVQYHRENDSGEGELFGLDFVTTCICAIRKAEGLS